MFADTHRVPNGLHTTRFGLRTRTSDHTKRRLPNRPFGAAFVAELGDYECLTRNARSSRSVVPPAPLRGPHLKINTNEGVIVFAALTRGKGGRGVYSFVACL